MTALAELARTILAQEQRIEQLDRRLNNIVREARVTEIDAAKALVKVEAHGLLSAWSPWLERAGAIRTWSPPSVGERVILLSPTGEPGQGLVLAGGYSDAFPAPHDRAGEHRQVVGDAGVLMRDGEVVLAVGTAELRITAAGAVLTVAGARVLDLTALGGSLMVGNCGLAITPDEVATIGRTRLNNGAAKVHRVGDRDSRNDAAVEGAPDVYA